MRPGGVSCWVRSLSRRLCTGSQPVSISSGHAAEDGSLKGEDGNEIRYRLRIEFKFGAGLGYAPECGGGASFRIGVPECGRGVRYAAHGGAGGARCLYRPEEGRERLSPG